MITDQGPVNADQIVWGKRDDRLRQVQKAAWFGAFRSQRAEFSYEITEIEGSLPEALLNSTWFHNGPSGFERGNQRVNHFLDGDGYLCRIAFRDDGRVFMDSRFVQTAEFVQEEQTDRFLFRSTFGTRKPQDNLLELYLKNPANVNAVAWGDRLLAMYEAGLPYQVNPHTLDTIGPQNSQGQVVSQLLPKSRWQTLQRFAQGQWATTAHPHSDPVRDRIILWHWAAEFKGLTIAIVEYDRQWQECTRSQFQIPGAMINPHDFALTPTYYVFVENRLTFNPLPFILGRQSPADCLRLQTNQPTRIHLVPRPDGPMAGQPVQIVETSPWFSIHQACAYDQPDGSVVVYSAGWPEAGLEQEFLSSWQGYAPDFDVIAPTYLWQTTIQPQQGTVNHQVVLENYCIEYPCCHPQYETQAVRYLYMTYSNCVGESSPPIGYLKVDLHTQKSQIWMEDGLSFTDEPVFVPAGGDEEDGWLVGMVYDHAKERSSLVILNAKDLAAGPVCRLWLNHRLVPGLHGSWVPNYYGPGK
ncbi:lignostilbene-alpha,beta-dioxygenase-like enzyme [Leptolyngbya sp. PCC 7375]|nr:lignostilbene-alpha,beta-dioxygenase-like enzyme [Leptolyngbya sp. PCC 7375]